MNNYYEKIKDWLLKVRGLADYPEHYNDNEDECLDNMEKVFGVKTTFNFCYLNVFKYIWRYSNKGNREEDLKKASWYCDKAIELTDKISGNETN